MLGLIKTCSDLTVSFLRYLGDCLQAPGPITIPLLPDFVGETATTA